MRFLTLLRHLRSLYGQNPKSRLGPCTSRRPHIPDVQQLEDRTLLSTASLTGAYGLLPMSFEANVGQTNSQVNFLSRGNGYTLFLTPTDAVLSLRAQDGSNTAVRMDLVGANSNAPVQRLDQQATVSNYFIGNDPSQWHTNVPNYGQVEYHGVYAGVDLIYYGNQQQLEYDFRVAPGADPSQIQLQFTGAQGIAVDSAGDLVLHTAGNDVVEHAPVLYQEINGTRQSVAGKYVLEANGQVGFQVGAYDPGQELIIDPVLTYSTYLGGSSQDNGTGIVVDSTGAAYFTGYTQSTNFPTVGAYQSTLNGIDDAIIAKLNPAGTALVYSTYFGGNAIDEGYGIALDSSGDVYVTGRTTSTNFPTHNPIQASIAGHQNIFITEFNPTATALVYSTYLGGNNHDWPSRLVLDGSNNAYVIGYTSSTNFPIVNALQAKLAGTANAFITKINAAGTALVYSTYLGGSGSDIGNDIAVDSTGAAYICGFTNSTNFPTANAFQSTYGGGSDDAFVAKLNPSGSALVYSTYLGGSDDDEAGGLAIDSSGNAYISGETFSTNFPTANAMQANNTGIQNAFLAKFNSTGTALVYSTYLGGNNYQGGGSITIDSAGDLYDYGLTDATNFPTVDPIQATDGGDTDAYVCVLNPAGSALTFSTYLGGSALDTPAGLAMDSSDNLYLMGNTKSTNFPTVNPLQATNAGGASDMFICKITIGNSNNPVPAISSLSSTSANEGSANLTLTLTGSGFTTSSAVDWNGAALATTYVSATQLKAVIPAADLAEESSDNITVVNPAPGGGTSNAEGFTVAAVPPTAGISGPTDGYHGVQGQTRTFTLTATSPSSTDQAAGFTYKVQWGDGQSTTTAAGQNGSGTNVSHVYAVAGSYTISVTATDDDGQVSAPITLTDTIVVAEQQGNTLMVGGTTGTDTFIFSPGSTAGSLQITVDSKNVGTFTPPGPVAVYGYAGSNKSTVNGTSGNDSFVLGTGSVTFNGIAINGTNISGWTLTGQGGSDTLTGPNATATWTISAAGGGKEGTYSFSGFTNLVGGSATDTFKFTAAGNVPGTIDGGLGTNKLDYSGDGGVAITVNLGTDSAPRIDGGAAGGFQNIKSLAGSSSGSDTLIGPNAPTLWTITGVNAGKAGSVAFTGIENLVGGTGLDTFKLSKSSARVSSIDGGGAPSGQGNWLDCSAFTATAPVTIDLNAGQVRWTVGTTNVVVSLANIENAVGGAGNDTLIGNSLGNILIGGSGNDTITGGTGRSVLIGDTGSDTITDGSGSDILISGTTTYDKNTTALMDILAEWQRTDKNYSQRIADLKNGGGLNGSYKLIWGSTLKDDSTADVLNGGVGGLDWFFANLTQDTLNNQNGNEQVN